MGDETFTKLRMTSPTGRQHSTSPHQAAYAAQRATVLFGSYRRGDANDPDAYVAAIAAVLSRFDTEVIREVTDPRDGIAATEKFATFMPNAGELKIYCDAVAARKYRMERMRELPPVVPVSQRLAAPDRPAGRLANVFVPMGHPRYNALTDWSQTADDSLWYFGKSSDNRDGIWVARGILETPLSKHIARGFSPSTAE